MNPTLTDVLGRLAGLSPTELAVVGATATTLAHGTVPPAPRPDPAGWAPERATVRTGARDGSVPPPPGAGRRAPLRHPRSTRPDLLATVAWEVDRVDADLFSSAAYRARLGPTAPVLCYVAGSAGLQALAVKLGAAVWKPGITAAEDVATRLSELAASRYGSCVRLGSGWHEEPGFEHFEAARLTLRRRRGTGSPVRPALCAIAVARPLSLPLRALDRALGAALAPAGLSAWAAGPDGAALCRRQRIDPALLDRHTPAVLGRSSAGRPRRATELTLLAPRVQADDLADVIERLIADHVMGQAPG